MASISKYSFDGGAITGTAEIQGTAVPSSTKRVIAYACLTNKTAGVIVATVYCVPLGGTAGTNGTTPIYQRPIGAGESYLCPELINKILNAGGSIQALGNGLEFSYSSTEFVGV